MTRGQVCEKRMQRNYMDVCAPGEETIDGTKTQVFLHELHVVQPMKLVGLVRQGQHTSDVLGHVVNAQK